MRKRNLELAKEYITALRNKGIGVNKTSLENGYIHLSTEGKKIIKIPTKINNKTSYTLFLALKEKEYKIKDILEDFFNNNFEDKRLEKTKSRNNHFTSSRWLTLNEFTLTTEGFYIKMSGVRCEQPLMINWEGDTLKRKQGKIIRKLFG